MPNKQSKQRSKKTTTVFDVEETDTSIDSNRAHSACNMATKDTNKNIDEYIVLNKALYETRKRYLPDSDALKLADILNREGLEFYYKANDLPLIGSYYKTKDRGLNDSVSSFEGFYVANYSGLINLSSAFKPNGDEYELLSNDSIDYINDFNSFKFDEYGWSAKPFYIADKEVPVDLYGNRTNYAVLEGLGILMKNHPPLISITPNENSLYVQKWRFEYWLESLCSDTEKVPKPVEQIKLSNKQKPKAREVIEGLKAISDTQPVIDDTKLIEEMKTLIEYIYGEEPEQKQIVNDLALKGVTVSRQVVGKYLKMAFNT